jgi:predicted methyltransferase
MTRSWSHPLVLALPLLALAACGSAPTPIAPPPPQPAPSPAPVVEAPPPVPTEAPKAEPTPEEKKKAEEARQLQVDRDKWNAEYQTEVARWTPDLHAAAKALADKTYPTGHVAIQAAMAGKHRVPGAADRDKYRHPLETLDLFGFKPAMTVVDIGPGEGWYTELLAPALAKQGKYFATSADPNGPPDARRTFYAQRFKQFLDKAPEVYGKTQTVVVDGKQPKLALDGQVDMVLIMRGVHGMVNGNTLAPWLAEIQRALKPGGVLGIEEHRAPADADPVKSSKQGYVPEKWLIDQVVAAGFKLDKKSEINANPKDTKDYPEGVWSLPPTYEQGDKDHDKYAAIGESDRMTLKFVKTGK